MQYIFLIGDENLTLDSIRAIEFPDSIQSYDVDPTRFYVEYGLDEYGKSDHIFYDFHTDAPDYSEYVLGKIPFHCPHFITMVTDQRNG